MTNDGKTDNLTLGEMGEDLAVSFLRRQRYAIVERNFRCKGGEVDIVAREGKTIVFVEVKTRRTTLYGPPQLSVTPFKQRQISKAALTWLAREKMTDVAARFDVIAIHLSRTAAPRIEQIKDAFDLAY